MKNKNIDRVELLHAIHKWCAGDFDPLIGFPPQGGFNNVVYLFDDDYLEMRERVYDLINTVSNKFGYTLVVFTQPRSWVSGMALTYKDWLEAGTTMKAIDLKTNEPVFVIPISGDNGTVVKYVSSNRSYGPDELQILKEQV